MQISRAVDAGAMGFRVLLTTRTLAAAELMLAKLGVIQLAKATGLPIVPIATWGGQYVWRRSGKRKLEFGRPIWLRAGEPVDVSEDPHDAGAVRRLTDDLMAELASLVDGLRAEYPKRWGRVGE